VRSNGWLVLNLLWKLSANAPIPVSIRPYHRDMMFSKVLAAPSPPIFDEIRDRLRGLPRKWMFVGGAIVLILAIAFASIAAIRGSSSAAGVTAPVTQATLVASVTASGTVNPQNTINVGTQVSGTIASIYADYNSKVHKGQVLARIDPSQLQAQLDQAKANAAQAQAQAEAASANAQAAQAGATAASENIGVVQANAAAARQSAFGNAAGIAIAESNVMKAQSAFVLAQQTLASDRSLLAQGYIAQNQFNTDQSAEIAAQSGITAAQAAVQQARALAASSSMQAQAQASQGNVQISTAAQQSAQSSGSFDTAAAEAAAAQAAQAIVKQDELNLQHTVITAPVDGTVIARSVSVGQTVAASLQTPTLFTIAQDQSKMEVDIAVAEPDIGNVKAGDPVHFSVLAYPSQVFNGTVEQVRENPTTVNSVVTYTVVTLAGNKNGELLPGMTATSTIDVASATNALVVPLQALQYHPQRAGGRNANAHAGTPQQMSSASPWGQTSGGAGTLAVAGQNGTIYVQDGSSITRVPVQINLISGTQAAVTPVSGTLQVGAQVVLSDGSQATGSARSTTTSPATAGSSRGAGLGRGL
jgi:HlyD family secretion protein